MAFGFLPKYTQNLQIDNLDDNQFLVMAIEAVSQLKWNLNHVSETGFIAYTPFSWSSWGEQVTVKIENGVVHIRSECTGSQLIDFGKNKKNVRTLLSKIDNIKSKLSEDDIKTKLVTIKECCVPKEDDILSKPPLTNKEKISDFFSFFKPEKGFFVTPILININIVIFIVMLISGVHFFMPENQDLLNWGANFRPLTLKGDWWRLFTSCFLHIGIFHLVLNMYALVYIGLLLEPYLGKVRFLTAYIVTGILASIASIWWNDLTISAGASGAIFGMYGVFLALLTTNLLDKSVKRTFLVSIVVFIGYNLLNGLKPNSGIDNAAHIGGLLSGLVVGYIFIPGLKKFRNKIHQFLTVGALTVFLIIFSYIALTNLPNDIGVYEMKMKEFFHTESKALEIYNLPKETTDKEILSAIKDKGIYYWNENLKLLDSCKKLHLSLRLRERNDKLKKYCEFRIKSYQLLYKTIEENTNKYKAEINDYNRKIESIISELNQ